MDNIFNVCLGTKYMGGPGCLKNSSSSSVDGYDCDIAKKQKFMDMTGRSVYRKPYENRLADDDGTIL